MIQFKWLRCKQSSKWFQNTEIASYSTLNGFDTSNSCRHLDTVSIMWGKCHCSLLFILTLTQVYITKLLLIFKHGQVLRQNGFWLEELLETNRAASLPDSCFFQLTDSICICSLARSQHVWAIAEKTVVPVWKLVNKSFITLYWATIMMFLQCSRMPQIISLMLNTTRQTQTSLSQVITLVRHVTVRAWSVRYSEFSRNHKGSSLQCILFVNRC